MKAKLEMAIRVLEDIADDSWDNSECDNVSDFARLMLERIRGLGSNESPGL